MANEEHNNTVTGVVVEALPNAMFRVLLASEEHDSATTVVDISTGSDNDDTEQEPTPAKPKAEPIVAYLGGKMKYYRIRVIVGDSVDVLLDPYGGKGRIVRRHSMPDKRITKKR